MQNYLILRKKYPRFVFEGFAWETSRENLEIVFDFRILPDIVFSPRVVIENVDVARLKKLERRIVDNLVFNLGLIEMLSYWKTTCSPEISVLCGPLDKEQIRFWQDLIMKGMGQYFFENKINFTQKNFPKIICPNQKNQQSGILAIARIPDRSIPALKRRFLVPVGGGKDSIVTLELLKQAGKEIRCFALNPDPVIKKVLRIGGCQSPVIVRRTIDPRLLELNQKGFLNGHTPFSAYLAFLSVLAAVLFDCKFIAFSNERSANEGNVKYLGKIINHQYSKSFEFEQKFRKYCQKYLIRGVEYFSFLRPLYELQIAKIFSRFPQYFKTFLSCNRARALHADQWCGQCPKCLFVFICLRPFLGEKTTTEIFGKNLSKDKKLLPILGQLTGERGFKPFECVGTVRETKAALAGGRELAKILASWLGRHRLPEDLTKTLRGYII